METSSATRHVNRAVDTATRTRAVVDGAREALSSARVLGEALALELVYLQKRLRGGDEKRGARGRS